MFIRPFVISDRVVNIFDATVPTTIQPDDAAATGSAVVAPRRDHKHAIGAAAPGDIGNSNSEGSSNSFSRADHLHNHPSGLGVDLHHAEDHASRHSSGGDDEVDHGDLAGLSDDDHTQYHKSAGDAGTGEHDFGGATSFEIPNNINPSLDAVGEIAVDTAGTYMSGQNPLVFYDGSQKLYVLASDEAVADREMPVYDNTSGKIQWEPHRINTNLPHFIEERASDPDDPAEGTGVIWQSNGTGTGDDGDILIKITAGAVTKTTTLVDFSAI